MTPVDDDESQKTLLDDLLVRPRDELHKTQADNRRQKRATQDDAKILVTTLEDKLPNEGAFSWEDSQINKVAPRKSSSAYSYDESVIEKVNKPATWVALVIGLLLGLLIRGFFVGSSGDVEQPPADAQVVELTEEPPAIKNKPLAKLPPVTAPKAIAKPAVAAKPKPKAAPTSKVKQKLLRRIDISPTPTYIRTGVDMGGNKFTYRSLVLRKPYRVVIVVTGVNGSRTKDKIIAKKSAWPLKSVRIQKRTSNSVRVIFDVATKQSPKYSISRGGSGLVVSIKRR